MPRRLTQNRDPYFPTLRLLPLCHLKCLEEGFPLVRGHNHVVDFLHQTYFERLGVGVVEVCVVYGTRMGRRLEGEVGRGLVSDA